MELQEYILRNMESRVIVRMELNPSSFGIGSESIRASLITADRRAEVMLHVTFDSFGGSGVGHLDVIAHTNPKRFPWVARSLADMLENRHEWDRQNEVVCVFTPKGEGPSSKRRMLLSNSNILVLQHLSRIMGALGGRKQALEDSRPPLDEAQVDALVALTNRLQGVVIQGNVELQRLTRLS